MGDSLGVSFGERGLGWLAVEGAVVILAGAGSDLGVGAVSDRVGLAGAGAAAGAGVDSDLVGAAGIGAEEAEMDRVSRSTILGRAFLPSNHSDDDRDGSIDVAGGKMLDSQLYIMCERVEETYSDWKLSDFRGTMKLSGSMDPPASLNPRAISFCPTSKARRGRSVKPRSASSVLRIYNLTPERTRIGRLVFRQEVQRVPFVLEVSDVSITIYYERRRRLGEITYPFPATNKISFPSAKNGIKTPL